jgi:hypothetical protein
MRIDQDAASVPPPGGCLWHVYAMIGKLNRRVYLLSADGPDR